MITKISSFSYALIFCCSFSIPVPHIVGCTNFDENIEDEWFIVFLLFELSKLDQELVIQVEDSDGYFLLIEAADHLPKWVNPKTSLNRSFIYKGQLHLLEPLNESLNVDSNENLNENLNRKSNRQFSERLDSKQSTKIKPPSIEQALDQIRDSRLKTVCSSQIQEQIRRRIEEYPAKIYSSLHKCKVTVPTSIAFILNEKPEFISHSIRAFYNRDDLDLDACRLMKNFPPKKLVKRIVKLPKFNYAQLKGQNYKPDSKLNWYYQSSTNENGVNVNEIHKQYDLGFKISCGFEILVSTYKSSNNTTASRQTTSWSTFLNNLKRKDYFHNLIENSSAYNERLKKARIYFENSELSQQTSEGAFIRHDQVGKCVLELLNDDKFDETAIYEQFRNEELNLAQEDSDSWLDELPDYLLKSEKNQSLDDLPSEITNCLQEFIKTDSDYKGIELNDNLSENPKKRKSDLKERAFKMMSDNLRSIITMKVSDSESDHTETDLSDYNYSTASSDEELDVNELKFLKQDVKSRNRKLRKEVNEAGKKRKKTTEDKEMKKIMEEMDEELSTTTMGKTFDRLSLKAASSTNVPMANCAEFEEDYLTDGEENGVCLSEVDIKFNTVKNLLGSFKEQNGLSGPAGNILSTLGVNIPKDLDS